MKARMTQARENYKAGDVITCTAEEFAVLYDAGVAISESEYQANEVQRKANEAIVKAREASVDNAIKACRAFAPKENTDAVRARALKLEAVEPGAGVEYINNLPVKASEGLTGRTTTSDEGGTIEMGEPGLRETIKGFIRASEPFQKQIKNGGIVRVNNNNQRGMEDAIRCSREQAIVGQKLANMIAAGADFRFDNIIKAGDYADPASNNPLGILNTGLTLQWNLGFLANQLAMLDDITTDISNTPAMFNQVVRTRYLAIPKVMLKSTSNAWPVAGAPTGSVVDVNITMDKHAGVPLSIMENILGATARQLFNEQRQPQLYALGEYITYRLVYTICNGNTRIANDGTTTSTITFNPATGTFNVSGATLKTFTSDLPEAMDEDKMPGGDEPPGETNLQRFAWVHGRVYAAATADTNFLLNQSIWGARNGGVNGNVLETGRFERIGNLKFRKSQLMTDQCTVTGDGTDSTTNGIVVSAGTFASATKVGFCGTRNALLFASRVPMDYTKVMPEIPSTAAVELATEPRTGLTFMVVKHLDHAYETANMRVQLMFGTAIGDERQGKLLVKS